MAIKTYVQKDGAKFYEVYVTVRSPHGRRLQVRKRGFKSLRQAEMQEFEIKRCLADKREDNASFMTWGTWFRTCIDKMRVEFKPSTIMNYEKQLWKWTHPVWTTKALKELSAQDVHDLIYGHIEGVSMNARKTILKMTKRIFQMAVEEGLLDRNPGSKVKVKVPEKKQAVLNATEVGILLREAKLRGHKFYEIWATAILTGMRSGELYALRWGDVDLENRRIVACQSWCSKNGYGPTKNERTRVVPMCEELVRLFKELKLKCQPNYEFVLPHVREWTMGEQAKVLREFCEIIGISSVKFHDLRATFITQMLIKGASLAQVMSIVGHAEIKTTNVYLRMTGMDLRGVTERLGFSLPAQEPAQVVNLWTNP